MNARAEAGSPAAAAARLVVESGAVYVRSQGDPFFFASGWASPIFIDVKRLISLPSARDALIAMALERIAAQRKRMPFDFVAGCELAGVPFAAIIADRLRLPLVVVRKQGKGFGRLAQFEGAFDPGAQALLVDDLSTDGVGKSGFRAAIAKAEGHVAGTFVLLHYAVFPGGAGEIASLMTLADVVAVAEVAARFDPRALAEVKKFAADAPAWSRRNGGIGALVPAPD